MQAIFLACLEEAMFDARSVAHQKGRTILGRTEKDTGYCVKYIMYRYIT